MGVSQSFFPGTSLQSNREKAADFPLLGFPLPLSVLPTKGACWSSRAPGWYSPFRALRRAHTHVQLALRG